MMNLLKDVEHAGAEPALRRMYGWRRPGYSADARMLQTCGGARTFAQGWLALCPVPRQRHAASASITSSTLADPSRYRICDSDARAPSSRVRDSTLIMRSQGGLSSISRNAPGTACRSGNRAPSRYAAGGPTSEKVTPAAAGGTFSDVQAFIDRANS
jgi:hypothetical protein